ncbi:MAG: UDP-2,3-diacylglucosamine diphosphatase LpxI [Planctomycetaceae bacterium]|jgi:UDP-2,3-diacylglucosamine hydrolase|nr:UDP-2,3-diacylglucosamine diphosphatase LpxI [Planctomycetaceae bacterium]
MNDLAATSTIRSPQRVGLIAGWGDFPVTVARTLRDSGVEVYGSLLRGHADPALEQYCVATQWSGVAKFGCKLRFFKRHGVQDVTMAGKLFKTAMFRRFAWLYHLPDAYFIKYFYHHFVTNRARRNDDELLLTVIKLYQDAGIHMAAATDFAPQLLIGPGQLSSGQLRDSDWNDIAYGWKLAKEMGRLDIGQSVAIHRGVALAIEAVEGTDACIERAGQLCRRGGFTLVKVAKPQQDMRFDVPAIGLQTLQKVLAAGGRVIAFEAHKTIVLNQEEVIKFANRHHMILVATTDLEVEKKSTNVTK